MELSRLVRPATISCSLTIADLLSSLTPQGLALTLPTWTPHIAMLMLWLAYLVRQKCLFVIGALGEGCGCASVYIGH